MAEGQESKLRIAKAQCLILKYVIMSLNGLGGPAIWLISYDAGTRNSQKVSIHHNLFSEPGTSYNIPSTAGIQFPAEKHRN